MGCLGLSYYGALWLVYTVDLEDLILNAMALECILDIASLVFEAVATAPAKHLIDRFAPMDMPHWPHRRGLDIKSCFSITFIPVLLVTVYLVKLRPLIKDLNEVAENLCGGRRDFVWWEDARTVAVTAPTRPYQLDSSNSKTVQQRAILEAIAHDSTSPRFTIWTSYKVHGSGFQEAVDAMQPRCEDILHGSYREDMQNYDVWLSWIHQIENYSAVVAGNSAILEVIVRSMKQKGCAAFREHPRACNWGEELGLPFKSPAGLCPRSCKCDSSQVQSSEATCPQQHKCWLGCDNFTSWENWPDVKVGWGNCVFPFRYNGQLFTACTSLDAGAPWCATRVCRGDLCSPNSTQVPSDPLYQGFDPDYPGHDGEGPYCSNLAADGLCYLYDQYHGDIRLTEGVVFSGYWVYCESQCAEWAYDP